MAMDTARPPLSEVPDDRVLDVSLLPLPLRRAHCLREKLGRSRRGLHAAQRRDAAPAPHATAEARRRQGGLARLPTRTRLVEQPIKLVLREGERILIP